MPRPPRLNVPGGCYHVILRGNHREDLFASPNDRFALNEIVIDVLQRFDARLHTYCWMTNHLHALLQINHQPLGKLMQRIAMRFSRYRHKTLNTTGHLFERRYKAWLVDVDQYFLVLLRYIHLNPVAAHMIDDPADYPYSSHRIYLGLDAVPWVTSDFGLSLFSADLAAAREAYQHFMTQSCDTDIEAAVHPKDARILGDDHFISKIPLICQPPRSNMTLDELAANLCQEHHGMDVEFIRSSSRARCLTPIRLALLQQALQLRVATLTEVANFLNRDPSALAKLFNRHSTFKGQ